MRKSSETTYNTFNQLFLFLKWFSITERRLKEALAKSTGRIWREKLQNLGNIYIFWSPLLWAGPGFELNQCAERNFPHKRKLKLEKLKRKKTNWESSFRVETLGKQYWRPFWYSKFGLSFSFTRCRDLSLFGLYLCFHVTVTSQTANQIRRSYKNDQSNIFVTVYFVTWSITFFVSPHPS